MEFRPGHGVYARSLQDFESLRSKIPGPFFKTNHIHSHKCKSAIASAQDVLLSIFTFPVPTQDHSTSRGGITDETMLKIQHQTALLMCSAQTCWSGQEHADQVFHNPVSMLLITFHVHTRLARHYTSVCTRVLWVTWLRSMRRLHRRRRRPR